MAQNQPPKLIGVGVGPGDVELITVKAVNALAAAELILVPSTEARADSIGRAEEIVLAQLPEKQSAIQRIPFSMAERSGVGSKRKAAWQQSAQAALTAFASGASQVAFATIGDPSVFSTFSYLCDLVLRENPDVQCEVIPGITAMQALAASSNVPLCEGKEILALVPATLDQQRLAAICELADTVTLYKGGSKIAELRELLADQGRLADAVIGTDIGLENQQISALAEVSDEKVPYFSTILSVGKRTSIGGKL